VEFVIVGIPLIFLIISVEEISRGMMIYDALTSAVSRTARFISVRGKDCACLTVSQIVTQMKTYGTGLDPSQLNVTLTATSGSTTCNPLNSCASSGTSWPSTADGAVGNNIQVTGVYRFNSALVLFWPGAAKNSIASVNLNAVSQQTIQY
jgi:hypothetical protein